MTSGQAGADPSKLQPTPVARPRQGFSRRIVRRENPSSMGRDLGAPVPRKRASTGRLRATRVSGGIEAAASAGGPDAKRRHDGRIFLDLDNSHLIATLAFEPLQAPVGEGGLARPSRIAGRNSRSRCPFALCSASALKGTDRLAPRHLRAPSIVRLSTRAPSTGARGSPRVYGGRTPREGRTARA